MTCISAWYKRCSFSDVCRSIKQEAVVQFTYNIHMPSEYSSSFQTHCSSRLHQDSKAFCKSDGDNASSSEFTTFGRSWSEFRKISTQTTFLWWGRATKSHMEPNQDCIEDGPKPGCVLLLWKVTVTFGALLRLFWILFRIFFYFLCSVDDLTVLITSNNHMVDEANTTLLMVIG